MSFDFLCSMYNTIFLQFCTFDLFSCCCCCIAAFAGTASAADIIFCMYVYDVCLKKFWLFYAISRLPPMLIMLKDPRRALSFYCIWKYDFSIKYENAENILSPTLHPYIGLHSKKKKNSWKLCHAQSKIFPTIFINHMHATQQHQHMIS